MSKNFLKKYELKEKRRHPFSKIGAWQKKYEWLRVNIFFTMKFIFGSPSAFAISTHDKP